MLKNQGQIIGENSVSNAIFCEMKQNDTKRYSARGIEFVFSACVLCFLLTGILNAQPKTSTTMPNDAHPFYAGGDISMLPALEARGVKYMHAGKRADALVVMQNAGCNCFRVRLFVNPNPKGRGAIQDLPYAIELGKRIKKSGAALMLDLHYSDTWADPGAQFVPAAWKDQTIDQLEKTVEDYSADVVTQFKKAGALPDMIQIGNEINPGIMWPVGKINWKDETSWKPFARLLNAGLRGVKRPLGENDRMRTIIHIAGGKTPEEPLHWFKHLKENGIIPDIIGLSHYPWHHGTIGDLKSRLDLLTREFDRDIIVVETAYPAVREGFVWPASGRTEDKVQFGISPQAQSRWWKEACDTIRTAPGHHGIGLIWWYPDVPVGPGDWMNGSTSWFDEKGNTRPLLSNMKGK